ncbi:hypothetical protein DVT68_03120 [Dyella solisilvae]|uniref:Uncharacterized protein n=1 Tax=Dyella solisilvae TaxID=1920168 RepID=A0A370KB10_9GAMM|nr:hypothetical protein [Dyella solisilvae]RDI99838.1 hypothetical protein DVT68_03120 [Dyella solisilvae]
MKSARYRLALLALLTGGVVMVGCSNQPTTHPAPTAHPATTSAPTSHTGGGAATTGAAKPHGGSQQATSGLSDSTGIPACDDYLASYMACHRAAGIFPPDQLESRFEAMRTSLLRDSQDPATRPQLGARCTALAAQLREALHGKSCVPGSPAAAVTSPGSR